MEKLVEIGLEKKEAIKKQDQNEGEQNETDENNSNQLKEAKSFNKSLKIMERMIIKN